MDKISNNMKFYTFVNILSAYTDEQISLSIKEINVHMREKLGVTLDRRTIYGYIKDMRSLGISVSEYDKQKEGYYIKSYRLRDYEIMHLIDAIRSISFISKRKIKEIVDQIIKFNSVYRGETLNHDTFVNDTLKTINDEILINTSKLRVGITSNKKITFDYCKDDKVVQHKVNPICLMLDNNNYYLIFVDDIKEVLGE